MFAKRNPRGRFRILRSVRYYSRRCFGLCRQEKLNIDRSYCYSDKDTIKKIPSGTVVNEEMLQEEQQPGPSLQCNNLAKSSNDESSNEEKDGLLPAKFARSPG